VAQSDPDSQRPIDDLQDGEEIVERATRAVNVPVMEKIKEAVEKPLDQVNEGKIHPLIITEKIEAADSFCGRNRSRRS